MWPDRFSEENLNLNYFNIIQAISESIVLTICMSFLFVRIHFVLKLGIGLLILALYSWIIFVKFSALFSVRINV